MKKYILYGILFLFLGSFASAQTKGIGIRFGYNFANLSGDIQENETLTAFHVGAFTDFKLNERLFLQPELMFSVQGSGFSYGEEDSVSDTDLKLSYLNIPVLLSYHYNENLSFTAGPQIGVLMGAKDAGKDIINNVESYDMAFSLGLAYKVYKDIRISARYNQGFVKVTSEEGRDWRHNVFQLSMAFIL